jgi:hypothetical protein
MSHAFLSLGQRDRSAPELGHTVVPGAECRIQLGLRLFQLFFRLFNQRMRHSSELGPKVSVDTPLIAINRGDEIGAHGRPIAIVRLIAVGAWHTGSATHCFMLWVPRLVRWFSQTQRASWQRWQWTMART